MEFTNLTLSSEKLRSWTLVAGGELPYLNKSETTSKAKAPWLAG